MKSKIVILLIFFALIDFFTCSVYAQTPTKEDIETIIDNARKRQNDKGTLTEDEIKMIFSKAVLREQFLNKSNIQYYRFAKPIKYYDNLGLSYFPSETLASLKWEYLDNPRYSWYFYDVQPPTEKDWALLGREGTGSVFKQMIYLEEPYSDDVFHGVDFPGVNYLADFYFYTDLFILDEFPENYGSGYVYLSNSVLYGNRTSYGILIDPRDGIYKAVNNYDTFSTVQNKAAYSGLYLLGSETHDLELIEKLDPSLYEGKTGSIGNSIYPNEKIDDKFFSDLESVKEYAKKAGMTKDPSWYRIELVRIDEKTALYINGVFVVELEDGLKTDGLTFISARSTDNLKMKIGTNIIDLETILDWYTIDDYIIHRFDEETWTVYDPKKVTRMVSYTTGPRLYKGGRTVTVANGNVILYTTLYERG